MLTIIGSLPEMPEGFRPDDFFRHPDDRVRREALRILIESPVYREKAVCRAISDPDERTVRLGLAAAFVDCPKAAVPLVISRAASGASDDQRVAAIRVLGAVGDAQSLDVLMKIVAPKKTLIGAIIRDHEVIIPSGNDEITTNDKLIIFTLQESIKQVEKLLR